MNLYYKLWITMKNNKEILTIRLTKEERLLLDYLAKKTNRSTGAYIRLIIDKALLPIQKQINDGVLIYDDIQTFFNDKLQFERVFRTKD